MIKNTFNRFLDCYLEKDSLNNPIWTVSISAEICGGMANTFRVYNLEQLYQEVSPKWHWILKQNFEQR